MFLDQAEIFVASGNGGNGAITYRREKYVPKGGPSGGDGGHGGSVIFVSDSNISTLLDFKYNKKFIAGNGGNGMNSLKTGKDGEDTIIKVPVGTIVKDAETDEILVDIDKNDLSIVLFKGGKGGKGNANFRTATNQTPRWAEDGKLGIEKRLKLELKLIADVGLVGFPNAGKSTLISVISAARPKIADYPFTTLEPNLGIVNYKEFKSFVVADIPGIIEGASEGKGLGLQFLKHIERTKILLVMIDSSTEDVENAYEILIKELKNYSNILAKKTMLVAFTKTDIIDEEKKNNLLKTKLKNFNGKPLLISSATQNGIPELLDTLWGKITEENK